jgi:hypothetical protein
MATIKSCLVFVPANNTTCVQLAASSVHDAAAQGLAHLTCPADGREVDPEIMVLSITGCRLTD